MAVAKVPFDGYKIWYHSRHPYAFEATIFVYMGERQVGVLLFFKEDVPYDMSFAGVAIPYPLSRFNDVITILREEKPLYLMHDPDSRWGCISTTDIEPTGEDEGK